MEAILAAITLIMPLINAATPGLIHFIQAFGAVRKAALQDEVWTPEQEANYQATLKLAAADPAWQPHS